MSFLVDNNLPIALARLIELEFREEAVHVTDVGLRDASDAQVWEYASDRGATVISKDEDFAHLVLLKPIAGLIWVRVGNCRTYYLLNLFRQLWPRVKQRLDSHDLFIELR